MRMAIFGAGGAGGYFGAELARAGESVVLIARGAHLEAIRANGLTVQSPRGTMIVRPGDATDDPAAVGPVDAVLLGVKTWQVRDAARAMRPMVGPHTVVVPLQNGVDAARELAQELGADHVLGGLCATVSRISAPGVIQSLGDIHVVRFAELDGRRSDRVDRLRAAFERAGVRVEVPTDIHVALWEKFLLVVSWGGVGAVTRAPLGIVRSVPETRAMLEQSMREILAVARATGIALPADVIERTVKFLDSFVPVATTSLQRDITEGKPSELEAWNGAVVRLGHEAGVATPLHEFIYDALRPSELRARGQIQFQS